MDYFMYIFLVLNQSYLLVLLWQMGQHRGSKMALFTYTVPWHKRLKSSAHQVLLKCLHTTSACGLSHVGSHSSQSLTWQLRALSASVPATKLMPHYLLWPIHPQKAESTTSTTFYWLSELHQIELWSIILK